MALAVLPIPDWNMASLAPLTLKPYCSRFITALYLKTFRSLSRAYAAIPGLDYGPEHAFQEWRTRRDGFSAVCRVADQPGEPRVGALRHHGRITHLEP